MPGNNRKKLSRYRWVLLVSLGTFFLAVIFSIFSEIIMENITSLLLSLLLLGIFIGVGVVFDAVGIAATVAEEVPFHSKASKKMPGARQSIFLIRNAEQVANICSDVIGDITGVVSGAIGAALVMRFLTGPHGIDRATASIVILGIIAALTVGGKAMGKIIAMERANAIIFFVGRVLSRLDISVGRDLKKRKSNNNSKDTGKHKGKRK